MPGCSFVNGNKSTSGRTTAGARLVPGRAIELLLWNLFALLPRQVALEGTVAVELACKALPMELAPEDIGDRNACEGD
jgi:hypothetical protein